MSKNKKMNLEQNIISQIKSEKIKMKPKWYFMLSSLLLFLSLAAFSMIAIFLVNLSVFLIRRNCSISGWRFQVMLSSFPWWISIIAVIGMILAVWILKKYEISYKKNFKAIIIIFVLSILSAGFMLDKLGLNEYLSQGRMKGYYQRVEQSGEGQFKTRGNGMNHKRFNTN